MSHHRTAQDDTGRWLTRTALTAGALMTASTEYALARATGSPPALATLLPITVDVYVAAAIRRGRGPDVALALALMGAAQVAGHLLAARTIPPAVELVCAVALVPVLVIWRVHALARPEPVPEPTPVPEPAVTPEPAARRPVRVLLPVPLVPRRQVAPEPPVEPEPKAPRESSRFREHVEATREWLREEPRLTGAAIGERLDTSGSYGRRVRRAALAT
jgi:hypothetical protein